MGKQKRRRVYKDRVKQTVYWSREEYRQLQALSDRRGRSMTRMVRAATLKEYEITPTKPEND